MGQKRMRIGLIVLWIALLPCLFSACGDEDPGSSPGQAQDDDDDNDDNDDDDNDDNDDDDNDDNNDNNDDNDDNDDDTTPPEDLKVITFNLRTGMALDGLDSWPWRKSIAADFVASEMPALMGTQEGWKFQLDYLWEAVPGYEWIGESRRLIPEEHCAIFYRPARFDLLDTDTFWLSDTPDVPGSVFSSSQCCPRIVTWALFADAATGDSFAFFNTHFDYTDQDEVAQRSAALLVEKIAEIAPDLPVLVTGDFNNLAGTSDAYRILTGDLEYNGVTGDLVDPWAVLGLPEDGSTHPWDSETPSAAARIDWILCSADFTPLTGEISHFKEGDHFPSDHFPVIVDFAALP